MPSPNLPGKKRGYVIPIGGAEDKMNARVVLERFVRLCGRDKARIVVIPTASRLKDTGERYVEIFQGLKVADVVALPILRRSDCERADYLNALESASGVFMTGGNQLRLTTIMGGTSLARSLRRLSRAGRPCGGHERRRGLSLRAHDRRRAERRDPHAERRDPRARPRAHQQRHHRPALPAARPPRTPAHGPHPTTRSRWASGLDEDTAAFIGPGGVFEVVGSGGVTIVDPSALEYSSMSTVLPGQPVSLVGLKLHILTNGAKYDTQAREAKL